MKNENNETTPPTPSGNQSDEASCSICDCCGKSYEPKPLKSLKKMTTACAECGVLRIQACVMDDKTAIQSLRIRGLMGKRRAIKSGNAGITPEGEIVDRRNHPEAMIYSSNAQA